MVIFMPLLLSKLVSEPSTISSPVTPPVIANTSTLIHIDQLQDDFPHLSDVELSQFAQYRANYPITPPTPPVTILSQEDIDEIILGIHSPVPGLDWRGHGQLPETPSFSPSPSPAGPSGFSVGPTLGPLSGPNIEGPSGGPPGPAVAPSTVTSGVTSSSVWVPI